MRAVVLATLAILLVAGVAAAEPAPEPIPPAAAPAVPTDPFAPGTRGRIDGAGALDANRMPIEDLDDAPRGTRKPSGFWTGYKPARSGAYRYRLLLIGVVVFAITALVLVRMLRRASTRTVGRPRPTS